MTPEIAFVLGILFVSLVLFVTDRLPMDVVALMVLATLALGGLVTLGEALAGFGNPAVVTVWAMFMLSAALTRTGVAAIIGLRVLKWAGRAEPRVIATIMLTAAVLSAFMNNIGVAALLLPVVMDIARRIRRPPSRLLMPLAFGCLLGGLTTLIGTPPNLLVSQALGEHGLPSFSLFDFTPVGGFVALGGTAFVVLVGRRLLPVRRLVRRGMAGTPAALRRQYGLAEHTASLWVPPGSALVGKTLAQSRLGTAARLNAFAVVRDGRTRLAPEPDLVLCAEDHLLVGGRLDRFEDLRGWRELVIDEVRLDPVRLVSDEIEIAELRLADRSSLAGKTLEQADFRQRFGLTVLAIRRGDALLHSGLAGTVLETGDRLLAQARRERFEELARTDDFAGLHREPAADLARAYALEPRLFVVHVPVDSMLVGRSLADSRFGDAFRLGILGIRRGSETHLMPEATEPLAAGDQLLVRGESEDLEILRGLQQLEIEDELPRGFAGVEGLFEAMLAPRTRLAGNTLRGLRFRERYGLRVVAILRQGLTIYSDLPEERLQFGDALLLSGSRRRLSLLAQDPDFLVLSEVAQETTETAKAPIAATIMVGILIPVVAGWIHIALAAVIGAALMVLARCLTMDEAYGAIEWRSIFLIAGMLPLGTAMEKTGAAHYLAENVVAITGTFGPWGVLAGLYLVTAAATMIVPTAALVVIMAPIVIQTAAEMDLAASSMMMAIAMAASASFTSPISHPANLLVMGPGRYRFVDYVKLGVPLTLVVMVIVFLTLPFFWPLRG